MPETYSDGEAIEREAVERIRAAGDRSALADLTGGDSDLPWPVRYHLEPSRANLLRPFAFDGLSVLDLGAGMGAATRIAAERARELTAVEGSPLRAEGLAARLAGLPQATVVVSRLEELALDRRFDVACLVGVLEHAERWVHPPPGYRGTPFDYVLERTASWLAPGGVLLLAIENRLGVKFWTGAAEEHTGRLFDGIAGYRLGRSERTFSRLELTRLLARSGLQAREWLFPFPDYKLPASVLSESLLTSEPQLAVDLATSRAFLDPSRPRLDLVPDALVLEGAARAGLLGELANSFLVLAGREEEPRVWRQLRGTPKGNQGEIAWHFAADRREAVRTVFAATASGVTVEKRLEAGGFGPLGLDKRLAGLRWEGHAARPIERGEPFRLRLLRRLAFGEEREALDELSTFLSELLRRFARAGSAVDGAALDATVANALLGPAGEARLFDLEWRLECPLPGSWLVLRNLLSLSGLQAPAPLTAGTLRDLHGALCARLDLPAALEEDLKREVAFAAAVRRSSARRLEGELESLLSARFPSTTLLSASPDGPAPSAGERDRMELAYRRLEAWSREIARTAEAREQRANRLEAELALLQSEHARLEAHAREAQKAVEESEAQRTGLEAHSRDLRQALDLSEGQRVELEAHARELKRALESSEGQRAELDGYARSLSALEQRQRADYAGLEAHARSLERLVASQQSTYAQLESYARALEGRPLPRVLAVIVHPRETPQLEPCLRAALSSAGVDLSIVLLLNACSDPLPGWVATEPRIRVLELAEAVGFGIANNRAVAWAASLRESTTQGPPPGFLLFLNNDAALRRDALERMIDALTADPRAAIAGPKLVVWGAEDHLNSLGLNLTRTAEAWDEGIGIPSASYGPLPGRREVVAVTGAALLVRTEAWRALGGWSEIFDYYMEDLDLCLRARGLGFKVLHVPDAEAAHAVSATAGAFSEFKVRLFWRNRWLLLLLHWPLLRLFVILPRVVAGELRLYRRRLVVGAREDARRQRESWREVLRLLPRIARERRWRATDRSWFRDLRPAGSVPEIRLPAADQSRAPWSSPPTDTGGGR